MTARTLRWGLVGLGSLARNGIVPAAGRARHTVITAGATRDPAKGREFGERFGIPSIHASYESLVRAPEVDAVFVMMPNDLHLPVVLAAADTISLLLRTRSEVQVALRASREIPFSGSDFTALGTKGMLRTGPLRWVEEFTLTITDPDRHTLMVGTTNQTITRPCSCAGPSGSWRTSLRSR